MNSKWFSFSAWRWRIEFWLPRLAIELGMRLFGRYVEVEGGDPVRVIPVVWKKQLHLIGLNGDEKFTVLEFISAETTRFVRSPICRVGKKLVSADSEPARVLHVILGHLATPQMDALLEHASLMGPDYEILLAYGGKRDEFERLRFPGKVFVDDPSLRGPFHDQTYGGVLAEVGRYMRGRVAPDFIFLGDYDTVPLNRNYLQRPIEVLRAAGAGFLGKSVCNVSYSNNTHLTRAVKNRHLGWQAQNPLNRNLQVYHSLGAAVLLTRECFAAMLGFNERFASIYLELALPTMAGLAGERLCSMDECDQAWSEIRFRPVYSVPELERLASEGKPMAHPVKDIDGFLALSSRLRQRAGVSA